MIKTFYAESLYEYMTSEEANVLEEQLENDSDFQLFEDVFFFYAAKENEIISKYPQLEEVNTNEYFTFKDFIGHQYEDGEHKQIGVITIDEEEMHDLATNIYPTDEEFCNKFMSNPSEALEILDHDVTEILLNTKMISIIEEAKGEGFDLGTTIRFFMEK